MSVKISGLVWDAPLPRDKKFIMLCYADHANHDGGDIWPSKERVVRMTGYSLRSVQTITADLIADRVLIEEGTHHPSGTKRYRINRALLETMAQQAGNDAIPEHISAPGILGGAEFAPPQILQGEGRKKQHGGGAEFALNPSVEPSGGTNTPLTPQGGEVAGDSAPAGMSAANKKKLPTTEPAMRIAALFHRRLTTPWSEKEIRSFRKLYPIDLEELAMLEGYYATEREKGDEGIHRRDLLTFLNNWRGEMDRANAWKKVSPNGHRSAITSENALSLPKR